MMTEPVDDASHVATQAAEGRRSGYPDANFRALWGAIGTSQVGSAVGLVTLPVIAVVSLGATAAQMSWLVAAGIVPGLVVRLPAAWWSDRMRRGRLLAMIICNVVQAMTVGLIPLLWWLGSLTFPLFAMVVGTSSALAAVYLSLSHPLLVSVVPRRHLVDANGKVTATRSAADIAGPALAGGLLTAVAAPLVILADAVSFLLSGLLLSAVRPHKADPRPTGKDATGSGPAAAEQPPEPTRALTELALDLIRRWSVQVLLTIAFVNGIVETVLVLFMTQDLQIPPPLIALLIGLGAVGGVTGGIFAGRVLNRYGQNKTLAVGALSTVASLALLPFSGAGVSGVAAVVLFELAGSFGGTLMIATVFGTLQASAGPGEVSRVMGLAGMSLQLAALIGAPVAGILGTWLGLRSTMLIALFLMVGGVLPQLVRWRARGGNADPAKE